MANIIDYTEITIQKIQGYLDGTLTEKDVSDWALGVIVRTKNLEVLNSKVLSAIQCLADLHDQGESWCPTRDELEKWKAELEKDNSGIN